MTGEDKVALLLGSLGPKAVERLLSLLPPEDAARVRARLQSSPPPADLLSVPVTLTEVAREFSDINRIIPPPPQPAPVPAFAPSAATTSNHAAAASALAEAPLPDDPLPALRELAPEVLANALRNERPSTISLTLGYLDLSQASAVLKMLPPEARREAVARQLQPVTMKPELVRRVLSVVLARCKQTPDASASASPDEQVIRMANLVRSLDREDRREISERLEETDPDMAAKVRKLLYRIEDVLRLDDRTMQKVLGELAVRELALALKGGTDEIKAKIMNNVSRRVRDNVGEEMELLANAQPQQIEEAQGMILAALRKLDEEGQLSL